MRWRTREPQLTGVNHVRSSPLGGRRAGVPSLPRPFAENHCSQRGYDFFVSPSQHVARPKIRRVSGHQVSCVEALATVGRANGQARSQ